VDGHDGAFTIAGMFEFEFVIGYCSVFKPPLLELNQFELGYVVNEIGDAKCKILIVYLDRYIFCVISSAKSTKSNPVSKDRISSAKFIPGLFSLAIWFSEQGLSSKDGPDLELTDRRISLGNGSSVRIVADHLTGEVSFKKFRANEARSLETLL
jgi:hypothetical protein